MRGYLLEMYTDIRKYKLAALGKGVLNEGQDKTKWQAEGLTCSSRNRKRWNPLHAHAEALNMLEEDYPETSQDIAYTASFFMLDVSARSWQAVGKKQCL